MGEELSMDNILSPNEVDTLFEDNNYSEEPEEQDTSSPDENIEEIEEDTDTTEDFLDPESVGSDEELLEDEEDTDYSDDGTSPNNFYSSIAKALKEEGVFPDLDDDICNDIQDPDDFRDLIEYQIQSQIDARVNRVNEALNAGVAPDVLQKYESTLGFIDSISQDQLNDESAQGEQLRKNLIYQDFINRGYTQDRALREVRKSFDSGSDIEDAREALASNRDYYQYCYDGIVNEAKEREKQHQDYIDMMTVELRDTVMDETDSIYNGLDVDRGTRMKIYDSITKPVYRDPDTGDMLTAIQRYKKENEIDFLKNVGVIYTLTNGFKDINGLIRGTVKKEYNKGLKNLEKKLNSTARHSDGSLKYVTSLSEDPNTFSSGWDVDV